MASPNSHWSTPFHVDNTELQVDKIRMIEYIEGERFLSTGGLKRAEEFIAWLDLNPGQKVLDVGSGLGGDAIYMAENCSVNVTGIDVSLPMCELARENLAKRNIPYGQVVFMEGDVCFVSFPPKSFDLIYSRDTLAFVWDKIGLFENFSEWLKPGGKLFFTDLVIQTNFNSDEFEEYLKINRLHPVRLEDYQELLNKNGFTNIFTRDEKERYRITLNKDVKKLIHNQDDFIEKFSEEDYGFMKALWATKLKRVYQNELSWMIGYGEK